MAEKPSPKQTLGELKQGMQSVFLATLGNDGYPHSGYTPFVFDGSDIIIFVSQLSLHTGDLLANGKVSAMLISDEADSQQIFARTRVRYQCDAQIVGKDDDSYDVLLDAMQERHGKLLSVLRGLPDFVLFRLKPIEGLLVLGFGQAYHLRGCDFDEFELATSA